VVTQLLPRAKSCELADPVMSFDRSGWVPELAAEFSPFQTRPFSSSRDSPRFPPRRRVRGPARSTWRFLPSAGVGFSSSLRAQVVPLRYSTPCFSFPVDSARGFCWRSPFSQKLANIQVLVVSGSPKCGFCPPINFF